MAQQRARNGVSSNGNISKAELAWVQKGQRSMLPLKKRKLASVWHDINAAGGFESSHDEDEVSGQTYLRTEGDEVGLKVIREAHRGLRMDVVGGGAGTSSPVKKARSKLRHAAASSHHLLPATRPDSVSCRDSTSCLAAIASPVSSCTAVAGAAPSQKQPGCGRASHAHHLDVQVQMQVQMREAGASKSSTRRLRLAAHKMHRKGPQGQGQGSQGRHQQQGEHEHQRQPRGGGAVAVPPFGAVLSHATEAVESRYEMREVLGKGHFGEVRACVDRRTGERLACKFIGKGDFASAKDVEDVRREVEVMRHLAGHAHVVELRAVHEDARAVYLVMELCAGGELFEAIKARGCFPQHEAARVFHELVTTVAHLHAKGVLHRDLKPENVLLTAAPQQHHHQQQQQEEEKELGEQRSAVLHRNVVGAAGGRKGEVASRCAGGGVKRAWRAAGGAGKGQLSECSGHGEAVVAGANFASDSRHVAASSHAAAGSSCCTDGEPAAGSVAASMASGGGRVKLADYGLALFARVGERVRGVAGSPFYMAPEVLDGEYGHEADVWSLGIILYILLCGVPPFWGETDAQTYDAARRTEPAFSEPAWRDVGSDAICLVRRLLSKDPRKRPAAARVLSHPWLTRTLPPALRGCGSGGGSGGGGHPAGRHVAAAADQEVYSLPSQAHHCHHRQSSAEGERTENLRRARAAAAVAAAAEDEEESKCVRVPSGCCEESRAPHSAAFPQQQGRDCAAGAAPAAAPSTATATASVKSSPLPPPWGSAAGFCFSPLSVVSHNNDQGPAAHCGDSEARPWGGAGWSSASSALSPSSALPARRSYPLPQHGLSRVQMALSLHDLHGWRDVGVVVLGGR
eukprot:jgi/Mesen1/6902/ME000353S05925